MKKYFFVFVCFLTACRFSQITVNNEKDKKDAENVVAGFYSLLSEKKVDSAMLIFHPSLLAANDPVKLKDFLNNISAQSVALTDRKLDHWDSKCVKGLDGGSTYSLYYVNHYQGGQELKVSIHLSKDDQDNIKISGLQMSPDKFQ